MLHLDDRRAVNPYELRRVEASLQRGERFTDQVGSTTNMQSSVVSQPLNPIHISDLNEGKFITAAYWKTLDYTPVVLFVCEREKSVKPLEIGLLPVKS
jgi:hypothetical protein